MKKENDNLCVLTVFKKVWQLTKECETLTEFQERYKLLISDLILEETEE